MMEITIHTGSQGDRNVIHVDWFDHNNVKQRTDVEIRIQPQDKPRILEISVNGLVVPIAPHSQ